MLNLLGLWLICGAISAAIATSRGEKGGGYFLIGLVLGPLGILMALSAGATCPQCRSRIHREARVCPQCRSEVPVAQSAAPPRKEPEEPRKLAAPPNSDSWGWAIGLVVACVGLLIAFTIISTVVSYF